MENNSEKIYKKCGNCTSGAIQITIKQVKEYVHVEVKRCNHCRHQYGIKETYKLEAHGE